MSGRSDRNNNQGGGQFGKDGQAQDRNNNNSFSNKSSNKFSNAKTTERKTLANHIYSIGLAKQAYDYFVIDKIL